MPKRVEWNPYAVRPVSAKPGVGAKEPQAGQPRFEDLLAEAERVQDSVRVGQAPAASGGLRMMSAAAVLAGTVAGMWQGLARGPWTGRKARHEDLRHLEAAAWSEG